MEFLNNCNLYFKYINNFFQHINEYLLIFMQCRTYWSILIIKMHLIINKMKNCVWVTICK